MSSAFQAFVPSRPRRNPNIQSFPSLLRPWHVSSSTFRKLEFRQGTLFFSSSSSFTAFLRPFRVISHHFRRLEIYPSSFQPRRRRRRSSILGVNERGRETAIYRRDLKKLSSPLLVEIQTYGPIYLSIYLFTHPSYVRTYIRTYVHDRTMSIYAIERVNARAVSLVCERAPKERSLRRLSWTPMTSSDEHCDT